MSNGSIITNNGKKILLYRAYTENGDLSATQYLPATQFKVGVTNGTPDVTDTDLDSAVEITTGVYLKDFVSGYPSLDFTNLEVTTRCFLTSLEANGNDINALGLFNEDSSALMQSIDVFNAESKSNTDEFVFVVKDRVI
jgi:hypothetical protein